MNLHGELLERFAQTNGCLISDLCGNCHRPDIAAQLRGMPWNTYPLEDCSYLLSYLLNEKIAFSNYNELAEYILHI